jgi:hypothetical protein
MSEPERCPVCRAWMGPAHACQVQYTNFETVERMIKRNPGRYGIGDQPTTVVHCRREPYDVYIGRRMNRFGLPQSRWANPYPLAMGTREQVIEAYRRHLLASPELLAALPELRGMRLGCWCKPLACHGDVLAELADATGHGTAARSTALPE